MYPSTQLAHLMREWSDEHRHMAEVLEWLASVVANIASGTLSAKSADGPHSWSYQIVERTSFVALILSAPSLLLARMIAPQEELPPDIRCGPGQVVFLVFRPEYGG